MDQIQCPVCGGPSKLKFRLKFNIYKCPECELFTSDAGFDFSFKSSLDEGPREVGLKSLRFGNFYTIVDELRKVKTGKLKGLEIGSGNGWWLRVCEEKGIDCTGVEPEKSFEDYHKENGLNVFYGFYPNEAVKHKTGYDFIIFNDVFEHIKDLDELIAALKEDLAPGGILIINLPMSDGFFYRMALILNRFGVKSYLERLWQFNFHSPHINYFNPKNLKTLMSRHGFTNIAGFKLNSLDFTTLKERIQADAGVSKLKALFLTTGISVLKPVIESSKPDIRAFFFVKE
jgi:2-polyprenyl-3-methyl-5-hydroxy-6-metoxy-1,4-benzoquinol methylase